MFIAMFHLFMELKAYPIKYDTPVYKIYVDSPNLSTVIRRPVRSSSSSSSINSGGNSGGTLVTNGDIHNNSNSEKIITNYLNRNDDGDSMQTNKNIIVNQHGIKLHVSDGAYPVYYALAKVNGKFGKIIKVLEENEKLNKI